MSPGTETKNSVRSDRVPGCRAPLENSQLVKGNDDIVKPTACIANLNASLADMERDNFAHGEERNGRWSWR